MGWPSTTKLTCAWSPKGWKNPLASAAVPPGREPSPPPQPTEMARVDAELLNQLLNQAGEVSIARARVEQQLASTEFNLAELARTVTRLKEQLAKLEIETEAQVLHRHETESGPRADFDPSKSYFWHLATNVGEIKIRLMPDIAPMHVSSTIYLARLGFYDGVIFHRVITGFMAQGGDPLGKGFGGPGYDYDGEFSKRARHDRAGLLSMANAGPGTDGSQFFLTFVPTPHLDDKHTIFGEVVEGMDTVRKLEKSGSSSGRTSEALLMRATTVSVE